MQSEGEEANPANHHITVLTWPQTCHPKLNQQVKQEQGNNDH